VLCAGLGMSLLVVAVPGWLVDHDLAGSRVEDKDRLSAVASARTTLLQAVGGLVVLYGGYVGWRQLRVSQETLRATQDGHLTDRFSRAVEQLGSDKIDVRIGGLHALRRIAEQSPDERDAVISIQAAYLRTHLRWPPAGPGTTPADTPLRDVRTLEERAADSQVALTSLGILCIDRRERWVNLSHLDLRVADCDGLFLNELNLDETFAEGVTCYHTNFTLSSLIGAVFRRATLTTAILARAQCRSADFRGARLIHADLRAGLFEKADFREANLRSADARGADFGEADLWRADLCGADLREAKLATARLAEARASDLTRWPEGFDWQAAGVVLVPDPGPWQGPVPHAVGVFVDDEPLESLPPGA
jgi:hypothetical protein